MIEHTGKAEKFIERFKELAKEKNAKSQLKTLAKEFAKYRDSEMNLDRFNKLDKEILILDCVILLCASKTVTKKNLANKDTLS